MEERKTEHRAEDHLGKNEGEAEPKELEDLGTTEQEKLLESPYTKVFSDLLQLEPSRFPSTINAYVRRYSDTHSEKESAEEVLDQISNVEPDMQAILREKLPTMNSNDPQSKLITSFLEFVQSSEAVDVSSLTIESTQPEQGPLMQQGEKFDGVYIILSGKCSVVDTSGETEREVATVSALSVVGEVAGITGKRTKTVRPIGPVEYMRIPPAMYRKFLARKFLPELNELVSQRIESVRDDVSESQTIEGDVLTLQRQNYAEGMEPVDPELETDNALLFLALQNKVAPLLTKEALDESDAYFSSLPNDTDTQREQNEISRLSYQAALLMQISEPDRVDSNQPMWHEYGIWTHTREVGNAIQFMSQLDPKRVSKPFVQELKNQEIDGKSKYDLLLLSLTLHDLGKAKPMMVTAENGDVYPSHKDHEQRSEQMILKALKAKDPEADSTRADRVLHSLLVDRLRLTSNQVKYIGRMAGLHFEFGKVRREAGNNFTMDFMKSDQFTDFCNKIFEDPNRQQYLSEIGLLFLLDTAGKTPKGSWKVDGVAEGQLPTQVQLEAMQRKWYTEVSGNYRPSLVKAYTSFQTSRATALRYLDLLAQRQTNNDPE